MSGDAGARFLAELGWDEFFATQLDAERRARAARKTPGTPVPGRVFAVQRSGLTVVHAGGELTVALGGRWFQQPAEQRPTIGDWVLLERGRIQRLLERRSLLKRRAAGSETELQLIAANVDTMFLVSSCNEDFNLSRMERYLTLALDAGVEPVVVLTKADQVDDPESLRAAVKALGEELPVLLVDARDPEQLHGIRAWCRPGRTVALLGSSGVGKSTLVNSLAGAEIQLTRQIRDQDSKGRHTTTHRSLHRLPGGGLLVDNPGMRELSLADAGQGVQSLFDDIDALAAQCRFRNCQHHREPGCAVRTALEQGTLDPRRLDSYRKLAPEQRATGEFVTERSPRSRALSRRSRQTPDEPDRDA